MQLYPSLMTFKSDSAGYLVNHAARLMAQALAHALKPMGITPGQFPLLIELWETDGLSQSELVRRTDLEQATVANTLTRMERDGLIRRSPHPDDGRIQTIRLTDRARRLREPALAAAASINQQAGSAMSAQQQTEFLSALRTVIGTLKRAD